MDKIEIYVNSIADSKPDEIIEDAHSITINVNIVDDAVTEYSNAGEAMKKEVYKFDSYRFADRQIAVDDIINELIREKYGMSEELAVLRQKDTKASEFSEYFEYCERCKTLGKTLYKKLNDIA